MSLRITVLDVSHKKITPRVSSRGFMTFIQKDKLNVTMSMWNVHCFRPVEKKKKNRRTSRPLNWLFPGIKSSFLKVDFYVSMSLKSPSHTKNSLGRSQQRNMRVLAYAIPCPSPPLSQSQVSISHTYSHEKQPVCFRDCVRYGDKLQWLPGSLFIRKAQT